jgi:hypothetical protein
MAVAPSALSCFAPDLRVHQDNGPGVKIPYPELAARLMRAAEKILENLHFGINIRRPIFAIYPESNAGSMHRESKFNRLCP